LIAGDVDFLHAHHGIECGFASPPPARQRLCQQRGVICQETPPLSGCQSAWRLWSHCGWCMDKWGVSWQITPRVLTEALAAGGGEQSAHSMP